jgi:acetyl esterase/lipase
MKSLRFLVLALLAAGLARAQESSPKEGALNEYLDREPSAVEGRLDLMQHDIDAIHVDQTMLMFILQHGSQVRIERVLYPANTADKEMIPGYVFTPAGGIPRGEKRPGLLIVHGGFHTCFEWRYFNLIVAAVQQGYAVMFPEYRGSTGYGETPTFSPPRIILRRRNSWTRPASGSWDTVAAA